MNKSRKNSVVYEFTVFRSVHSLISSVGAFFRTVLFCFANMLIMSSFLGGPKKTTLPGQARRTDGFADKLLRIRRSRKQRDRCWPPNQSETSIGMSRGTGSLRVRSQAVSRPFLKTFATFLLTELTGSPRMSKIVKQGGIRYSYAFLIAFRIKWSKFITV